MGHTYLFSLAFIINFCTRIQPVFTNTEDSLFRYYDVCSCNLEDEICDLNCCCDETCTEEDSNVFSRCDEILPVFDEHLCTHPITRYWTRNSNPLRNYSELFCIARDNNEERHIYPLVNEMENWTDVETLINGMKKFHVAKDNLWTESLPENYDLAIPVTYKSTEQFGVLSIPFSMFSDHCDTDKQVYRFKDQSSECLRYIDFLPNDCSFVEPLGVEFYKDFIILNFTNEIKPEICKQSLDNCDRINYSKPIFDEITSTCQDVVAEVHYIFTHDVFEHFESVTVKYVLTDITYLSMPLNLKQRFFVQFKIVQDDSESLPVSGNPGYQTGKGVLAGWLQDDHIEFNNNRWLQVPVVVDAGQLCLKSAWSPVIFGENIVSSCMLVTNTTNLHERCNNILRESSVLLYHNLPSHVGQYGDSDPSVVGDWVPVLISKLPSQFEDFPLNGDKVSVCSSFILGLHIEIAYSSIGFEDNRQAKIIGVLFTYSNLAEINPCVSLHGESENQLLLTISVTFVNVAKSPIDVFAPLPTWDVRLPYDFFYPFTSNSSPRANSMLYFYSLVFYCIAWLLKGNTNEVY